MQTTEKNLHGRKEETIGIQSMANLENYTSKQNTSKRKFACCTQYAESLAQVQNKLTERKEA